MNIKKTEPVKTVLIITVGFILVFLATKMKWALTAAFLVGVAGIASDFLAEKIDFVWMKLTRLLGYIMPNVLLSAVFFLFLTPMAALAKLFKRKDSLMIKNPGATAYVTVNKQFDKESLETPW